MLISWLLYPVLLAVAALGHGLLLRRILGGPSTLLVLPLGFASMIVVCTLLMGTSWHGAAWVGIVVPAAIGLLAGRGEPAAWRRAPRADWAWPAAAALGVFAIFAAPVLLSGENSFTGYSTITDIANHFDLSARLISAGRVGPSVVDSSYAESLRKLLGASYPTGLHSLLGAWSELLGRELAWLYQPTLAFAAPMAALGAYGVLRWARLPAGLRAFGALIVVQPNLLYAYGLGAGFKELFAMTMILVTTAILIEAFERPGRALLAAAVPMLAGYDAFAGAIAPWLGLLVVIFALAAALRWPRLRALGRGRRGAVVGVAALVVSLAVAHVLSSSTSFTSTPGLETVITSQTDLGNLAAPLDPLTSAGIWLTGDYRFPLSTHVGLTHALIYLLIALAALGALSALWRRRPEIAALAGAAGITLLVVPPRTGPWVDAKIFAITGALVLALAFFGLGALAALRRWGTPLAWALGLVVGGGVLYGNALAYHNTTLAPRARLDEIAAIGRQYAGQGPALAPSFDEYAEYFLRNLPTVGRVNPPNGFPGSAPQFGADIDQIDFHFVESFRLLVLRRNPARSRPPSNYRLVDRTRFYDVWQRVGDGSAILTHNDLYVGRSQRTASYCRGLAKQLAAHPGEPVRWGVQYEPFTWLPTDGRWSPNWVPDPAGGALHTRGPGHADGAVQVPAAGRYEVWQTGSFERPTKISIDGRLVATLSRLSDYPGEAVLAGVVRLSKGSHKLEIRRGGGGLGPGNGDASGSRYVGPLYLVSTSDRGGRVISSRPRAAFRICRSARRLDWVEQLHAPA